MIDQIVLMPRWCFHCTVRPSGFRTSSGSICEGSSVGAGVVTVSSFIGTPSELTSSAATLESANLDLVASAAQDRQLKRSLAAQLPTLFGYDHYIPMISPLYLPYELTCIHLWKNCSAEGVSNLQFIFFFVHYLKVVLL